jgi:predicted thioesterase
MRPGPARGTTAQHALVVDATMTDAGRATGPADGLPSTFGTLSIAEAIAAISRELLDGHLEADEIAVPGRIEIIHRTPIVVGTPVKLEATVQMVEPTRVTCEVLVRTPAGVAARSSYEQEVVTRAEWLARLAVPDAAAVA